MKYLVILFALGNFFSPSSLFAQGSFPPGTGAPGTTAIYKDSSVFVAWAINCIVNRGYQDIADTSLGKASVGIESDAIGAPDGTIISLGDSGVAELTFSHPILNGPGPDFAVFENGFSNDFLELAFVEVSTDGINYYRFPAVSEIQDTIQTATYGTTDPTRIHNLAGKYRAQYGTPFDLEDINVQYGIQIATVTHIRIIDVIGSINYLYPSKDMNGVIINDPYPTGFPSGGFDLDAVGVIHQFVGIEENRENISIYPNPVTDILKIKSNFQMQSISVLSITGELLIKQTNSFSSIDLSNLPKGNYILKINYYDNQLSDTYKQIIKL